MAAPKPQQNKGPALSSLIRQAGQQAKATVELAADSATATTAGPKKAHIFNVLDYIEQSWGLGMRLYPVQRVIVKLYYHIPLDDKNKTIEVRDMFRSKVLYHFTEAEYVRYLHSEGRCNIGEQDRERRELLLSIGRRAGKCLVQGSLVLTQDGYREIQDLGDPNGPEYQPLIVTVAQEGSRRSTSAFFYNGGERDTLRVRSRCGYEVEGTPNHRIKVMTEDGTVQWRFLADLKVGDRLGVHRGTDLWAQEPLDVTKFQHDLGGRKELSLPTHLTPEWGTLLGILVGDGSWNSPASLDVTVGPYPEWREQVRGIFRELLGETSTTEDKRTKGRTCRISFSSRGARRFLHHLGFTVGVQSHEKRVPWSILRSPVEVVCGFLRGLFETDGSVERGYNPGFSTASSGLASDVQLLLLNLGIVSRVKPRYNKRYGKWYYFLSILGADSVRLFGERVGFLSERKKAPLAAHLAKGDQGNRSPTEAIPFQHAWCRMLLGTAPKNLTRGAGWRRSLLREALGNVVKTTTENLSYPRLRAALAVAREVGADRKVIAHFEEILAAGYFYDEVTEIHQGRGRVYDLNVPDGESFVANGLTNHNTTLSGIFASYEVYRLLNLEHPQGYYGLPSGNRIQIISVATDKDQAGLLFNEVTTHLSRCEYFKPYIANNTLSHIQFRTPYDIRAYGETARHENGKFVSFNGKATMRVTFKSCIAKGLRGSGNIVIILDEMAHFQDKGNSSAESIYNAVTPSALAFSPKNPEDTTVPIGPVESRIICISSPLNKSGKFYELYHLAMSNGPGSANMLAIQAPTWEVNPTVEPEFLRQKYHADPATFMTEYGAQFSDRVRGWIEREVDLTDCIDSTHRPAEIGIPRYPYSMGIDIGLMNDGTSVFITHCAGDKIVLDYHETWYAGVDWRQANPHLKGHSCDYARRISDVERLDFDEIANWIFSLTKRFFIVDGIFDRWNGIPLEQALRKKGLNQFKSEFFTRDFASKIYQNAKLMMFDRKLQLYDWPVSDQADQKGKHSPFIQELLTLQAEQSSKNVVLVSAPSSGGYHDDQADAFVRSVWLSAQRMTNSKYITSTNPMGGGQRATNTMSLARYQMGRDKAHGGIPDRRVPKRRGR